jgi:two-component sensor histidine kinase/ABC-type multidrug transport system ATPase subunit
VAFRHILEGAGDILSIQNLRIDEISKGCNEVNLDLKKNEIHAIMGESGAGKTGLAQILAGIKRPSQGMIYINNQLVDIKSPSQPLSLGIGVLFQDTNYSFLPHLTVKEFLYIWFDSFFISNKRLAKKSVDLFQEYEINLSPSRFISELNQEEYRILFLMKILARDPAIIVLDEPTVDLSESKKQHFFRIIRRFAEKGGGVLYLSNKLDEILQISDQVTILKDGGTIDCFTIDYAKKNPQKVLGRYFGREESTNVSDDEFKDVIDTILHSTELLTSEYELQDLLNLLAEKITEASKADGNNIILLEETSMNVVESFRHLPPEMQMVEVKEDIIRNVISGGKPLIAHSIDREEMERFFDKPCNVKAMVCMPIKIRTKINGIIEVFYSQRKYFSQEDIELLMTFATQVAIAVENSRLLGRSTLLKEAHHRIKNNLQSIISMLILQLQSENKKSLKVIIWQIIDRIKTIANVHEILSKDEQGIGLINFQNLIKLIVANFHEKDSLSRIEIAIDAEDLFVSYRSATSLGLVVNELLANCFEHAFPEGTGKVILHLHHDENQVLLQVIDNGVGFEKKQLQSMGTLGLSLVKTLVNRDLRGTLEIMSQMGTRISIVFPKKQVNY